MAPLVSIIIPSYNADQWISETLQSVLAQTWMKKEVIVINDGSTDATLKIAQSFASHNVKVISQNKKGAAAARNKGLKEAQGDFIQFLDADDLLDSHKIEAQINLLNKYGSEYVASGSWARFSGAVQDAKFNRATIWQDMSPIDWLCTSWQSGETMILPAWLVPRIIVDKVGGWNEIISVNDDGEYFCRVILAVKGVVFSEKAKSYYRVGHSGSLSQRRTKDAWLSVIESYKLCEEHVTHRDNSQRVRDACAARYISFICAVYPDMADLILEAKRNIEKLKPISPTLPVGNLFKFFSNIIGWEKTLKLRTFIKRIRR